MRRYNHAETILKAVSWLLPFLLGFLLSACASIDTNTLARPVTETSITLSETFVYTREHSGLANRNFRTISLAPGRYVSTFEDADGTYYRSQGNEIVERRDRHDFGSKDPSATFMYLHDGGIYLPKDSTQPARVFLIAGTMRTISTAATGTVTVFAPGVSTGTAVVGGVVANGIIAVGMAAERGNYAFLADWSQPDGMELKRSLGQ